MAGELGQETSTEQYGGVSEREQDFAEIHNKFYALSADLEVCTGNILNAMRTTTNIITNKNTGVINGWVPQKTQCNTTFFVLTKEQDEDLFKELAHVNKLLGKARAMLNAYITIENSLPDFKMFFNRLHDIEALLDTHKDTIFFRVHVRDNKKYLYPKKEIEKQVLMFTTMVGGICGTLQGVAEFIKDSPLLEPNRSRDGYNGDSVYSQPNTRGHNRLGIPETTIDEQPEQSLGM